jgi:hypothetical protein
MFRVTDARCEEKQAIGTRRPGFAPGSVHMRFVVDSAALWQDFLRVIRFSPVSIISPLFHITNISSGEWTKGPLGIQFRRDISHPIATIITEWQQTFPECNFYVILNVSCHRYVIGISLSWSAWFYKPLKNKFGIITKCLTHKGFLLNNKTTYFISSHYFPVMFNLSLKYWHKSTRSDTEDNCKNNGCLTESRHKWPTQ